MAIIIPTESRRQALRTARTIRTRAEKAGYPGFVKAYPGRYESFALSVSTADYADVILHTTYYTLATLKSLLTPAMLARAYERVTGLPLDEAEERYSGPVAPENL